MFSLASKSYRIVNNKKDFETFCLENGFPCVKNLGEFGSKKALIFDEFVNIIRKTPVVIKPIIGSRGKNILYIELLNDNGFLLNGKEKTTVEMLKSILKNKAMESNYLIQPLLSNHRDLCDLTNGWLASVRMITVLDRKDGSAEYLLSAFQMPIGKRITCNLGLFAPIEEKAGTLGTARLYKPGSGTFYKHPNTNADIIGKKLPYWEEIKELAVHAHTALGEYSSLGWDISITDTGPIFLETNSGWDAAMIQIAHGIPLGKTKFPGHIISYLHNLNLD